ncbi:hypothetical protein [Mesorhizobium sp. M0207]|uniref:hypothetical protein n=1 Tax=Mesorhizobium sp. M0207 TaxID=2956915 RepID=UPI00333AE6A4
MSRQLWFHKMKRCFLLIFEGKIFGVPMVTTKTGWEKFVGPATLIGELSSTKDLEIGIATREMVEAHVEGVPDGVINPDLLIRSVSRYGLNSVNSLFQKCLQMSVEKEAEDKYKLTPYARSKNKGTVGAEELDTILFSNGQPEELGCAVRKCISYCR